MFLQGTACIDRGMTIRTSWKKLGWNCIWHVAVKTMDKIRWRCGVPNKHTNPFCTLLLTEDTRLTSFQMRECLSLSSSHSDDTYSWKLVYQRGLWRGDLWSMSFHLLFTEAWLNLQFKTFLFSNIYTPHKDKREGHVYVTSLLW